MEKQEALTKLSPYLPYDLKVSYTLKEAGDTDAIMCPLMLGEFVFDDDVTNIKPHLRPFSQLTETFLHNGKEIIPAAEIMFLAIDSLLEDSDISAQMNEGLVVLSAFSDEQSLDVLIIEGYEIAVRVDGEFMPVHNQVKIVDALRSMHFAVGFEDAEYIAIGIGAVSSDQREEIQADSPAIAQKENGHV